MPNAKSREIINIILEHTKCRICLDYSIQAADCLQCWSLRLLRLRLTVCQLLLSEFNVKIYEDRDDIYGEPKWYLPSFNKMVDLYLHHNGQNQSRNHVKSLHHQDIYRLHVKDIGK